MMLMRMCMLWVVDVDMNADAVVNVMRNKKTKQKVVVVLTIFFSIVKYIVIV